ncbi:hypothetical protein BOTBODRAFT_142776 [Botryobasidium botryosum FD-172 SS1]|uniref:Peptidase S28 n=1 Tax=Botryobasidium botryosum (strain FD-172 SS1) TaxID=930990 RepID=A0A067MX91_BOTB1|nr:hypothetical protein BOTBODRAFT_142776 [Botryobasidium botryosum FD-172 SS1]
MIGFRWLRCIALLLSVAGVDAARKLPNLLRLSPPAAATPTHLPVKDGVTLPPYNTTYTFEQLIDHTNPGLGTFKQRYFFTHEYYEPGGPVILYSEGEGTIDGSEGDITNSSLNGLIARATKGAVVAIEHRFFGKSSPYPDLSEESYRVHTLEQSIDDLVYFAKTVDLPMPGGDAVGADKAPWLLFGSSYAGALASWTMTARPGVFWAGYASSAVVQAIDYYWGYFEPIRQHMPRNCSADVQRVVSHMDLTFTTGSPSEIDAFKAQLGLSNVTHLDDVATFLSYPLALWQFLDPTSGPDNDFFKFCDALEVKNGVSAPADGWGLEYALEAFGKYMNHTFFSFWCGGGDVRECADTYDKDSSLYRSTALGYDQRSWIWLRCNYLGYSLDGAPPNWPSLVSRLVGPAYDSRQCSYYFPKTFPTETSANPKTAEINSKYRGWETDTSRLFFANGKRDPWREATVSSDFISRPSTPQNPIAVSDGFHGNDMYVANAIDPTIAKVQDLAVEYFTQWIKDYHNRGLPSTPTNPLPTPDPFTPESIPASIISASPSPVPSSVTAASGPEPTAQSLGNGKPVPRFWNRKPFIAAK